MIKPIALQISQMLSVGTFGRSVGLKGNIRVSLLTDFPEILNKGLVIYIPFNNVLSQLNHILDISNCIVGNNKAFYINNTKENYYFPMTIKLFNESTNTMRLNEINNKEEADCLKNMVFYNTIHDTRELCGLKKDEFFYFDVIGMEVIDDGIEIGVVKDIQEISNTHYFVLDKNFLIPYIDRYVLKICIETKQILTKDAKFLRIV